MMCSLCERQWNRTLSNAGGALLCLTRTGYQRLDSLDRWKFRILRKFYLGCEWSDIYLGRQPEMPVAAFLKTLRWQGWKRAVMLFALVLDIR